MTTIHIITAAGKPIRGYHDEVRALDDLDFAKSMGATDCYIVAVPIVDDPTGAVPVLGRVAEVERRAKRRSTAEIDEQVTSFIGLRSDASLDEIAEGAGMERGTAERAAKRLEASGRLAFMGGRYRLARAEAAE